MSQSHTSFSIWTVTDNKIGMLNQARGLAEAIASIVDNTEITEKRVCPSTPWRWLPGVLWPPGVTGIGTGSDPFNPPWPDIVISCGRHAIGPTLMVKRKSLFFELTIDHCLTLQRAHCPKMMHLTKV